MNLRSYRLSLGPRLRTIRRRLVRGLVLTAMLLSSLAAVAIVIRQPDQHEVTLDALFGIAAVLATTLSLGFTVTLLIAQHTAERHAGALYVEFRKERAWLVALGLVATGVALIMVASLVAPTKSTAWASVLIVIALGLLAASLLPQMLDSLDRSKLAERITGRIVRELETVARHSDPMGRSLRLEPIAIRGLDIAGGLSDEGIAQMDRDATRAGFAGIRQILLAYLRAIPTEITIGGDAVVQHADQQLEVSLLSCVRRSPIQLAPIALRELERLAVDAASVPNAFNDHEPVSGRLNRLLVAVTAMTVTEDSSAAAAMATGAIGEGGVALIAAGRPTGVTDHISQLRFIALRAHKEHVVGEANHELARIALGLTGSDSHDIMPPSLFSDACDALAASFDAFIGRASTAGPMMRDNATTTVTRPFVRPNLALVVHAGLAAEAASSGRRGSDFGDGADALMHALCRLASHHKDVWQAPRMATDTAHGALSAALTLDPTQTVARHAAEWWKALWGLAIVQDDEDQTYQQSRRASELLLTAACEAVSDREPVAGALRQCLREALGSMATVVDADVRARLVRAWIPAAIVALGSADEALGSEIIRALRPDLLELERVFDRPLTDIAWGEELLTVPIFGLPIRVEPTMHRDPMAIARFGALLHS